MSDTLLHRLPICLLLAVVTVGHATLATASSSTEIRGMTISCEGAGQAWGSDAMVETMRTLQGLGVNWVAIHPYGGIRHDGTVGQSRIDRLYHEPSFMTRPIREAKAMGLKVLIKPHLAYWGTRFSWRGEIQFETDEEWQRFFDTYRAWITLVARLSEGADGFVVGTELDQTVAGHESEWAQIIESVKSEFDGALTYAAGWDTYRQVSFWEDLDVVSIQGYFPLVAHEEIPTNAELEVGWQRVTQELETFGREKNRRVVFSELGYNRSLEAAVRPWAYQQHRHESAEDLQLRCLDAAFTALDQSDVVIGAFLWKWFPGDRQRGNFMKAAPRVRDLMNRRWGG